MRLNDEERAIVEAARDFADKHLAGGALAWDKDKSFPVDQIRAAGEMGLGSVYTSEEHGGSGLSRLDGVRIFEQLATADPSVAAYISIHNMVCWMIDEFGTDEQRERWVPGLAGFETFGSYCLTEPGSGSDAAALSTKAVKDGDDYVLTGVKQFISGGGFSDVYIVMARTGAAGPRGISAFVVEKGTPGLSFGPNEVKMGWNAQPTTQVIMEGMRVPAANLLGGEEGQGFRIAMRGINGGRINIAACSLGGAVTALAKAKDYLASREAFGMMLIDESSLRHRLADMATKITASRALLWQAAEALDAKDKDAAEQCAMAKKFVTDACYEVADDALQLHGGYGYLHEYGIEKIVRDLRVHRILEGSNEIMNVIIARSLVQG